MTLNVYIRVRVHKQLNNPPNKQNATTYSVHKQAYLSYFTLLLGFNCPNLPPPLPLYNFHSRGVWHM